MSTGWFLTLFPLVAAATGGIREGLSGDWDPTPIMAAGLWAIWGLAIALVVILIHAIVPIPFLQSLACS